MNWFWKLKLCWSPQYDKFSMLWPYITWISSCLSWGLWCQKLLAPTSSFELDRTMTEFTRCSITLWKHNKYKKNQIGSYSILIPIRLLNVFQTGLPLSLGSYTTMATRLVEIDISNKTDMIRIVKLPSVAECWQLHWHRVLRILLGCRSEWA